MHVGHRFAFILIAIVIFILSSNVLYNVLHMRGVGICTVCMHSVQLNSV